MTIDVPRIDDIDFEQLVAEAKARIPIHNPDWTNHSDADPGITLLHLFGFMTESMLYRANRIPERNRQKFLRLIGLQRLPATPARGLVTFDSTKGALRSHLLAADSEVRAGAVPFRSMRAIDVLPISALVCAKTESSQDLNEQERARYLAMFNDFGPDADDVVLYDTARLEVPSGATTYRPIDIASTLDRSLWVALLAPKPEAVGDVRDQLVGKTLSLGILPAVEDARRVLHPHSTVRSAEESRLAVSIPDLTADSELPAYRRLPSVEYGDVLVEPGTVTIELPGSAAALELWSDLSPNEFGYGDYPPLVEDSEADRIVTWLRLSRPETGANPAAASKLNLPVAWLGVNATPVEQLNRIVNERVGRGTGQPDQVVQLNATPVLPATVEVRVGRDRWTRIDDLQTAPPEVTVGEPRASQRSRTAVAGVTTVYTVDAEGTIRFGSGMRGARPGSGEDIIVTYSSGGGRHGLLPAGAISAGVNLPTGVKVINPIPTWGGADTEPLEEAERRTAELIRHQDRCVTKHDIMQITTRTPGVEIGRVEVLPVFHPELGEVEAPGVITVLVLPASDPIQPAAPRPDRMFLDTVCDHLDSRRLVTTEMHVRGPDYVPLTVSIGFDTEPGREIPPVREAIDRAVRGFLSPLPTENGEGGWLLGKAIDDREILTQVARVAGVSQVNGVSVSVDGFEISAPHALRGLELPHLIGLAIQPGDPVPLAELTGVSSVDPKLLPVPAIPEEC